MNWLKKYRDRSIRAKLTLVVLLNGSLALLLAGAVLLRYERYEDQRAAIRELSTQASIVADSSTAALCFSDEKAARDTLKALRAQPDLTQAAIYDVEGHVFASYARLSGLAPLPVRPHAPGVVLTGHEITVWQAIHLGNDRLGAVFLRASTAEADARLRRYTGIACAVLLLSLAVALGLSARMQRLITGPIIQLSNVAGRVSAEKDYSLRAVRSSNDELGFLIDAFNEMLRQIELHEQARIQAEKSMRDSEERYALAARGANDGLWDWNLATGEIYLSSRWNEMLGYEPEVKWNSPEDWLGRIHPADSERVRSEIASHREGKTTELISEYRLRKRNGAYIWVLSRGIAVRDTAGNAVRMAGSQTDITEGKIADPLTGLHNRLYFVDRIESSIDTSRRTGIVFAVLFLDLDRFKLINDSLGHAAGDELLAGIASRLQSSLRSFDANRNTIVRSIAARLGGDEFGVLIAVHAAPEPAVLAEQILQQMQTPFTIDGRPVFGALSIGIALSSPETTPEELLRSADTAMYAAKKAGKSRYAIFDEAMRITAISRLELETELRTAINNDQLTLEYQPQISFDQQRITGFEALARWNHPVRGMIPPSEFIPVAEETGLIIPLGRWVLEKACAQLRTWQSTLPMDCAISVAVNVSFQQLKDANFINSVRSALERSGIRPDSLRLEMTESAVMESSPDTRKALQLLKALNLRLEIDDFGTGYSSLSQLNALPFDTLKIDRSFVNCLNAQRESWAIVRTVLDLARSMHLDVIAEGVETKEQARILSKLGCGRAQGFYFSRPIHPAKVPQLLQNEALSRGFRRLCEGEKTAGNNRASAESWQPSSLDLCIAGGIGEPSSMAGANAFQQTTLEDQVL